MNSSRLAARARAAPVKNAALGETRVHITPNIRLDTSLRRRAPRCRYRTRAPCARGREVGDPRLLHAFGQPEIDAIARKIAMMGRASRTSRSLHRRARRRCHPSANDSRRPNRSKRAARERRQDLDDVQPGPQQRNPERRDAEVVEAKQQERVARIAQLRTE